MNVVKIGAMTAMLNYGRKLNLTQFFVIFFLRFWSSPVLDTLAEVCSAAVSSVRIGAQVADCCAVQYHISEPHVMFLGIWELR